MAEEIDAMRIASEALAPLDEESRLRVLQWLNSKYSSSGISNPGKSRLVQFPSAPDAPDTFAEFFHLAAPASEKEKAAVAAYWAQYREGHESFGSQLLNSMLKELGYKVSNITDALTQCIREKPSLIIQMKKSGTSKQARKTYKMTEAGRRWVETVALSKGVETYD